MGCSVCNLSQSMVEPGRVIVNGSEFADSPELNSCSAKFLFWTNHIISQNLNFPIHTMG